MPDESFKLVDEKHVSTEVDLMLWSPKLDLIALANAQGEVVLHRLSWQKVWTLAAPAEGDTVGGLAWRPDGKVLAIGYVSGKLRLCDIEKGEILNSSQVEGEVTCMSWVAQHFPENNPWTNEPYGDDNSAQYLPRLQPLNKNYNEGPVSKGLSEEVVEDSKRLKDQKELNFLVVGTNKDVIHMIAFGVFPVASVFFTIQDGSQERRVCSAIITEDLNSLSVVVESTSDESDEIDYYLLTFDTTLLKSRHKEIRLLALKYGQVCVLVEHLQTTIQQMAEAWEDILTEMDSKLLKFAEEKKKVGQGTVSNDFLELLLFGTPSPELQNFLLHELTEKGLKKLGYSIETSYSNIQKLVVKHLQTVSQALVYHLSELQGMAQWYDKFGVLGLEPAAMQEAIKAAGAFVVSACDLQQVIDGSIKNFKAFFRWLYVVILRLSKEEVPAELSKMTQYDINFVAEFLRDNFTHFIPEESRLFSDDLSENRGAAACAVKPGFKLEKVGQYLKKEDLAYPSNMSNNPWVQFVQATPGLLDSPFLYPIQSKKSLQQLRDVMDHAILAALEHPMSVIGQYLQCSVIYHLYTLTATEASIDHQPPKFCQFTDTATNQTVTIFAADFLPCDLVYILRQPTDISKVEEEDTIIAITTSALTPPSQSANTSTSASEYSYFILDLAVYDQKTLSLLLVEDTQDGRPALVQFPLWSVPNSSYTSVNTTENIVGIAGLQAVDIAPLLPSNAIQHLEYMKAHSFAVSGSRKTATVLFHSRRRVRIFLMDTDEDEDEEEGEEGHSKEMEESKVEEGEGNSSVQVSWDQLRALAESRLASEEEDENKENTSISSSGGIDNI